MYLNLTIYHQFTSGHGIVSFICYGTFYVSFFHKKNVLNKRAQRALGRSPEEKVKGHSGANNREPQGHNLNNFGRGPIDDVIYEIWKHWALQFQTRSFVLRPIYWPRDLLMQPNGTVWTTLIGDHPGINPVKFGEIPISGSREDVV